MAVSLFVNASGERRERDVTVHLGKLFLTRRAKRQGINLPFYVLLLVALGALKGARPVEREAR